MYRVRGIIKAPKEITVLSYVSFHYLNMLLSFFLLSFLRYGDMLIFSDKESRDQENEELTQVMYKVHGSFRVCLRIP